MELQRGQRVENDDLTDARQVQIRSVRMNSGEADCTCFGVDAAGKLSDDRYFIFYNPGRVARGL